MYLDEIEEQYYRWLCFVAVRDDYSINNVYSRVLRCLYETPFEYTLQQDANRSEDGLALMQRYANEYYINTGCRLPIDEIQCSRTCSVLEVLVSLSIRIEETIMTDPSIGDRTSFWFREMLLNLGLLNQTDTCFNKETFDHIINTFMYRKYDEYGRGGLFYVQYPKQDMRMTEIWYQAMWYLSEHYE